MRPRFLVPQLQQRGVQLLDLLGEDGASGAGVGFLNGDATAGGHHEIDRGVKGRIAGVLSGHREFLFVCVVVCSSIPYTIWTMSMPATTRLHKIFCANIKARRVELSMTQQSAADQMRVSVSYYNEIEAGRHCPSLDTVERVATVLKTPAASLLMKRETAAAK
jgi:DNA-binding XRE family transcriptional regulator